MDLIKIGKFIAAMRKEKNLTQSLLAEKLGITDRAISKWERGICLPDAGIMVTLCEILGISVNELLTGGKILMEENKEKSEENLVELVKKVEQANRLLLRTEIVLISISIIVVVGIGFITDFYIESETVKNLIMAGATLILIVAGAVGIRIETKAGYYECKKCGHKYVPSEKAVFWAMHIGYTRYLECSECGKKNWHKKVLS